jgi:Flp pilus assembly protein TadD
MADDPYDRARLLLAQNRYALAAHEVTQRLGDNPEDAEGHVLLALCRTELNDTRAYETAARAVKLEPDYDRAHYAVGYVELKRQNFAPAEAAFRRAIELNPWHAGYHGQLSGTQFLQYRWREALASADDGLAIDPDDEVCLNGRAQALTKLGRHDEAAATLTGTLERNPEDAFTHANRGWTLLHEKKPDEALVHFRESLRLDPNSEWARQGMLEALRAKNWVYRQLLGFFLWMGRFKPRTQILLTVGLYFAARGLGGVMDSYPATEPFLLPVLIGYLLFVMLTWFATPFRDVALSFSRDGRMLLTGRAIVHAVVASTLAMTTVAVFIATFFVNDIRVFDVWIVLLATTVHYLSVAMVPAGRFRFVAAGASILVVAFFVWLAWERAELIQIRKQLFVEVDAFRELPESEDPNYLLEKFRLNNRYGKLDRREKSFLAVDPFGSYASLGVLLFHLALRIRARKIQFR